MSSFCRIPLRRLAPFMVLIGVAGLIFGSACGGGGGTGGTGNNGNNGSTGVGFPTSITAQAFFKNTEAPASGEGINSNPYTLAPHDIVQVQLWGLNSVTSLPQQVPAAGFSFAPPAPAPSVATLSPTGALTAVAASSGTFAVNVSYNAGNGYPGGSASFLFQVVGSAAKVSGLVFDTSQNPVAGVTMRFYDSGGIDLLDTLTGANGQFIANVPTSAAKFVADGSELTGCEGANPGVPCFFTEYAYGDLYYSTVSPSCYAPLPALVLGKTKSLPSQVVMLPSTDASSPPPPPTGCQG